MKYQRPSLFVLDRVQPASAHCLPGTSPISTGTNQGCYDGSDTAAGDGHSCVTGGLAHGCQSGAAAVQTGNTCFVGAHPSTCIAGATPADTCNSGQSNT
jgi:hypothetical protein